MAGDAILVIDLDPQGNTTSGFGLDRSDIHHSVYEAIIEDTQISDLVVSTDIPGLSIVPSSISLAGAEVELAPLPQRERRLARVLAELVASYDYILLDCPPSLGLLTVNALTAADAVVIPIQCEYYALEGLSQLIATINLVRNHLNPDLAIKGVVLTMYDPRTNLSAEVDAEVRKHLGPAVFDTIIPRSVRLSEAPSYGLPIATYRPDSPGAAAYQRLAVGSRARFGAAAPAATADPSARDPRHRSKRARPSAAAAFATAPRPCPTAWSIPASRGAAGRPPSTSSTKASTTSTRSATTTKRQPHPPRDPLQLLPRTVEQSHHRRDGQLQPTQRGTGFFSPSQETSPPRPRQTRQNIYRTGTGAPVFIATGRQVFNFDGSEVLFSAGRNGLIAAFFEGDTTAFDEVCAALAN